MSYEHYRSQIKMCQIKVPFAWRPVRSEKKKEKKKNIEFCKYLFSLSLIYRENVYLYYNWIQLANNNFGFHIVMQLFLLHVLFDCQNIVKRLIIYKKNIQLNLKSMYWTVTKSNYVGLKIFCWYFKTICASILLK